jgi:hypothetical protein
MKRVLIILFIVSGIVFSQSFPKGFKISPKLFNSLKPDYKPGYDKIFSGQIFTPAPVTSNSIISNFISDIIVVNNPAGDTIWFGTGKGLSRTTNRGLTFQNYYGTDPFGDDDVSGIAVYKNWVVVSTAYSQLVNEENVPTGTGIKVSSDYGTTWKKYPQPMDAPHDTIIQYGISSLYALPVVVDEDNLSYDILITRKNLTSDSLVFWISSWAGGTRKSTDFGKTWQRVVLPPDNLNFITPSGGPYTFEINPRDPPQGNNNHKGFSVGAENDSTIYAGTADGINKSTDWGISWRKYNFDSTAGVGGDFVVAIEVQKFGFNSIVWAATNVTNPGEKASFSYTTNSGLNWAYTLDNDAVFSHNIGFKDSIVYAATDNGIWRSFFKPNNFSWSKPSIIYDEEIRDQIRTDFFYAASGQGDSVWVGSGDGLARTTDTLTSPWVGKWKIFRAHKDLVSTSDTYAAPNPFSPDDEVCRIYFRTGKAQSNVTVKIFDFAMFPVRTVIQNASRSTQDVIWVTWDGKRDDGMQVVNGVYFYRIEVDKDKAVWGKILVLQ